MPLFDWIHSNLHDLNLDWIINKIKNVETAEANSAASAADANAAKVAAAGSATAANNSKTAAAGSATAAAASAQTAQNLVDQLDTTIAADVTAWLNTHVTPTSPIVDDTLTISGAAADAKKTGDEIAVLKTDLDYIDDALIPVYVEGETLTPTTNNGWYISQIVQLNTQQNQDFKVSTVPVEAGKRYRIRGTTRLQAEYPIVAFADTDVMSIGAQGTLVITGSATVTTYDQYFDAHSNGYLWIASYSTREILSVTVYDKSFTNLPVRQAVKVQLFGDSITDNTWGDLQTWVNYMAQYMPVYDLTIVNSAVGGSRLSKGPNTTNAVENLVEDGTTVQSDADIIVIWAGTNDWAGGGPELGTFLGTYGIYGAVKNIIQTLSTNAPNALILFATPLQRYNATDQTRETDTYGTPLNTRGYTLKQFCDAIMETCEYYGIPCIDMNGTSGINRINVSSFTSDGLHPNTAGDKRIAHEMCKKIDSLLGYCQ